MSRVLPILFNTDMVRAILDNRKTVTRRVLKNAPNACPSCMHMNVDYIYDINAQNIYCARCGEPFIPEIKMPYQSGDILYVRETWTRLYYVDPEGYTHYDQDMYFFAADGVPDIALCNADGFIEDDQRIRWRPSIHMPKEIARLWIKVTDVRVEKLQDMDTEDDMNFIAEGASDKHDFIKIWDSTVGDQDKYGWYANPWVWVIEFERCGKPEEN